MAKSPHSSTIITLATLMFLVLQVEDVCATCESPQYTEYGKKGIIKCVFISESFGIYWYESVNSTYQLVIRLEQEDGTMIVSGNGYTSGMFDMLTDGSLVITNVTTYDDQTFKVVQVDKNYLVEESYVELFTAIFSKQRFPHISACNNDSLCLLKDLDSVKLTCSYKLSRPAVVLEWYRISHEGEDKIQGETLLSEDGEWTFLSTMSVNITNFINGPLIAFICRAYNPAVKTAITMQSAVIIDTTEQPWLSKEESEMRRKYLVNASTEIPCSEETDPLIIVWKEVTENKSDTLMFAMNGTERFVKEFRSEVGGTGNGSLILPAVSCESYSIYTCTFFEGTRYITSMIEVTASERCSTTATGSKTIAVFVPVLIVAILTCSIIFLILICRKYKRSKEDIEQEKANEMDSLDRVSEQSSIVTNENDVYEKHLTTNADPTNESTPLNFLSTDGSDESVEQLVKYHVIVPHNDTSSSCSLSKEDHLEKLKDIIKSLMSHRLDNNVSSIPFAKDAIDILRSTPVQIQLKKKKEVEDRRNAIGALVFGLMLAPFSFGIGLLYVVTGFASLIIGLSNDELVTNEKKWGIAKPMLEKLIRLQQEVAYIMALTSTVCEVVEFVQSNSHLLEDDEQNKLQSEIKEIKQPSRPVTVIEKLVHVREVTVELLDTFRNSKDFTDLDLGTKIERAKTFPFRSLCHNVSKCLYNVDTFGEESFFVEFIKMVFVGDEKTVISTSTSKIIEQNVRKIIRGVAAAGIALKAANVDTNLEFLEKELEELLDEDTAEYTVSLDDTVDLMEKMNAVSKRL